MSSTPPEIAAQLHARAPRLLLPLYRHAVRKKEGAAWFKVRPSDKPGEVVEIPSRKRRSA